MPRVAVTGATGAMGATLREAVGTRGDAELGLAVTRADPGSVSGEVPVVAPAGLPDAIGEHAVEVLVDFSVPEASVRFVEAAAGAGVGAVVGTTGFSDAQHDRLVAAGEDVPVLVSANFSRGIQALVAALEAAAGRLASYDVEVTETHHNRKRDAPSGTADRLASVIEDARPGATRVHGRAGEAPRAADEIGMHARRAGAITGEHEVLLAGNAEEVRLVHRAESRRVFAEGALDAAVWLAGKPPGWYRYGEVVEA